MEASRKRGGEGLPREVGSDTSADSLTPGEEFEPPRGDPVAAVSTKRGVSATRRGVGEASKADETPRASAALAEGRGAPPNEHRAAGARSAPHRNVARRITPPRWLHAAVILVSLLPLLWILYALASDFFQGTRLLGSNPIKEAEHGTGEMTIRLLFATLAVTPAIKLSKQGWLIRYRRTFGLLAFTYVCTHLLIYFTLDLELIWGDLVADLKKRVYIMFGMAGFILLLPLAITSTKGWIRRLGSKRWNGLHRAVYAVVVTGMVHYWMAVKRDITAPLIFAVLFACLFGFRIWWNSRRSASK